MGRVFDQSKVTHSWHLLETTDKDIKTVILYPICSNKDKVRTWKIQKEKKKTQIEHSEMEIEIVMSKMKITLDEIDRLNIADGLWI